MRREDVSPLLVQAGDLLPEPDLADAAWAAGLAVRRRLRRTVMLTIVAVIVALIVASIVIQVG
ncbi:hypothetical protein ACFV9C_22575 [Kribbella sp. NPDC059898]|uniref:hypothetical protein n=1 Tax=Kribbella sp. NPDC059898 TaxID=3346995 RepID=UPI00365D9FAE